MQAHTFLLAIMFASITVFGQTDKKIEYIRKTVTTINADTNFTTRKLENEYFVNKGIATDNGQELQGYFKNGALKKVTYSLGLSFCMRTVEYYFAEKNLVFVFEKEEDYADTLDSNGAWIGWNYYKLVPAFEGRYYFDKGKMIDQKTKGKEKYPESAEDREKKFLSESKKFTDELINSR